MEDLSFVPDLPNGPLDVYRNNASFNWKRLKLALEGDIDLLKLKVRATIVFIFVSKIGSHCNIIFVINKFLSHWFVYIVYCHKLIRVTTLTSM